MIVLKKKISNKKVLLIEDKDDPNNPFNTIPEECLRYCKSSIINK